MKKEEQHENHKKNPTFLFTSRPVAGKLNHRRKMRKSEQPSHPQINSSFANPRRREDEEHKNDLRSWREREREPKCSEEGENENGEREERESAEVYSEGGGSEFLIRIKGRGVFV